MTVARKMTPLADRFWSKVSKDNANGCWIWTAGIAGTTGYGKIQEGRAGSKQLLAHRVSYMLAYGEIPPGANVCHTCDSSYPAGDITYRKCVNPDHLWLGSTSDNQRDMAAKARSAWGIRNSGAKLSEDEVRSIRSASAFGASLHQIARATGISRRQIGEIVHRTSWAKLD